MLFGYKIIAVCTSKIYEINYRSFIQRINKELVPKGYRVIVYSIFSEQFWHTKSDEGELKVFDLHELHGVDYVVICKERIKDEKICDGLIEKAKKIGAVPIVLEADYKESISVIFDYDEGFKKIVEHAVFDHNYDSYYLIGGMRNNDFSDNRIRIAKEVLLKRGFSIDDENMCYGDFWSEPTAREIGKLIEKCKNGERKMPRCIISVNDVMAITTCRLLTENGYKVPEDVAICGFDGIEDIYFSEPAITSCECSYEKYAEKVIDIILGESKDRLNYVEPKLILNGSCGCCKETKRNASARIDEKSNELGRYVGDDRTLYELIAHSASCETIEEISKLYHSSYVTQHVYVMIKSACLDSTISLEDIPHDGFRTNMYVMIDSENKDDFEGYEIYDYGSIPDFQKHLDNGKPLIFVAINYLDKPLGYACYHFEEFYSFEYYLVHQLTNALNNSIGAFLIKRYQQYLQKQVEDIYKLDVLTGALNRNGFMKWYRESIMTLGDGNRITMILADLDGLKFINDHYGHNAGDNAITVVARALKIACNDAPRAAVSRFGGDELLAVIPQGVSSMKIKSAINIYLDSYNNSMGNPYKVSASIGVYTAVKEEFMDFDSLFTKTDELMYKEKASKQRRS